MDELISDTPHQDRAAAAKIQTGIRQKFQKLFVDGYTVTALEVGAREVSYVLESGFEAR